MRSERTGDLLIPLKFESQDFSLNFKLPNIS